MTPPMLRNFGRAGGLTAIAAFAMLVAACGGTAPSATPIPVAPTTAPPTVAATAAAGTVAPFTAAPPTLGPTTKPVGSGTATVNLAFTGTRVFTAIGTNGTCKLAVLDGETKFGFEASKDDYPALGQSFSVGEVTTVSIKWVIDANISYANNFSVIIQTSDDHHTVTLDQDLEPLSSGGGPLPGPQHVKGTISCSS